MANTQEIRFPEVEVQLTGQDGNIFMIIGAVRKALRRAGHGDQADAFVKDITSADSYTDALARVQQWVTVD
jgi:hypothetical protein